MRSAQATRCNLLRELADEPVPIRVVGNCMHPYIRDQALVHVRSARVYWPGDVVVSLSPDGRFLAHRIIGGYFKGRGWRWLTQADAASRPDASISSTGLIGRICGGDCSAHVARVPLAHRIAALAWFGRFVLSRLARA